MAVLHRNAETGEIHLRYLDPEFKMPELSVENDTTAYNSFDKDTVIRNCMAVYESMLQKLRKEKERSKEFQELYNQIQEYKKSPEDYPKNRGK